MKARAAATTSRDRIIRRMQIGKGRRKIGWVVNSSVVASAGFGGYGFGRAVKIGKHANAGCGDCVVLRSVGEKFGVTIGTQRQVAESGAEVRIA